MRTATIVGAIALFSAAVFTVAACSSAQSRSGFGDDSVDGGGGPGSGGEGGSGPGFGVGEAGSGGCQGIGCKAVACGSAPPTTITGYVYDPAGKNPLYNAIVYIPTDADAPLPALSTGVSCDKCGATALNPVASALTDETGLFTLTNVPVMPGVPVVVQVGKWRKKVTIDVTTQCAETKFSAPVTLPKNGTEGDMPQIAVTQGAYDALECLMRGIGVSDTEFVAGAGGTGHIHLYNGIGGGGMSGGTVPNATTLWDTVPHLSAYDIVGLSCEGQEDTSNKPASSMTALQQYADQGGRVFATHFHYVWFKDNPDADWKGAAKWSSGFTDEKEYPVVSNFPKGLSFAKWLKNVGASTTQGIVNLDSDDVTDSMSTVGMSSQAWVTGSSSATPDTTDVKYFSFNTPIPAAAADQCGRAVFGDIHVSGSDSGGEKFPAGCAAVGTDLTPQQKALEFLFFDLSSCVQSDSTPPAPPH